MSEMYELRQQLNRIEKAQAFLLAHLDLRLDRSHERQNKMAVDTTKLLAVVDQLKADSAKNTADIQAIITKLGTIVTTDPATQAVIDQAVADLSTIASATEASNAAAEAAAA